MLKELLNIYQASFVVSEAGEALHLRAVGPLETRLD